MDRPPDDIVDCIRLVHGDQQGELTTGLSVEGNGILVIELVKDGIDLGCQLGEAHRSSGVVEEGNRFRTEPVDLWTAMDNLWHMADRAWSVPADLAVVRESLFDWFEANHRPFPWRDIDDPWQLLVLEVMSQQTQLERVTDPWSSFVDRWPTTEALSAADRGDVIAFWSQHRLGYNRRARYLHEAATQVESTYEGSLPQDVDELQELPGVGPYTANAVASFAFDSGGPVIDTNVKRVFYRAFAEGPDQSEFSFEALANELMPAGQSRLWNSAIMELGGVACQKTPRCDEADCPWRGWCYAYQTGDFTAPDVPTQSTFEGSRRQYRGRIIRSLSEADSLAIDELGHKIRVDYTPQGEYGRAWLRDLLSDLADDGLVEYEEGGSQSSIRLKQ